MNWPIYFLTASVAVLVVAVAVCIKLRKKGSGIAPIYYLVGGVYISAFLLLLPLYSNTYAGVPHSFIYSFFSSLHHAIQLFTLDADRAIIEQCYEVLDGRLAVVYAFLLSFEYILAPIFMAGFVIGLIKKASSSIKYKTRRFQEIHVFSELNEKSLALAVSIYNDRKETGKEKDIAIVFTDVFENNEEASFELIEKAKNIDAICFKQDLLAFNPNRKHRTNKLNFYVIGEDETENINHAIAISNRYYKKVNNCMLYVFTTRDECEYLINQRKMDESKNQENGIRPKIRRVNEISSLIYHILDECGYDKLFKTAKISSLPDDSTFPNKTITAVIVGVGLHGTEMIKSLSWFCQMESYRLNIEAFDKDALAEKKFKALCPELMENKNPKLSSGDSICQINFHVGIDVASSDFADEIKHLNKSTYILVSLGSDIVNIRTAINIRTYLAQAGITQKDDPVPVIQTIVYKAYDSKLSNMMNHKKESYSIEFIGDLESIYRENVILNSRLEQRALSIHRQFYDEESFYEYEYYYRSSCAAAIHTKAVARELSEHKVTYKLSGTDKLVTESINAELLSNVDLFLKVVNLFAFDSDKNGWKCKSKSPEKQCPGNSLYIWADKVHQSIIEPLTGKTDTSSLIEQSIAKQKPVEEQTIEDALTVWDKYTKKLGKIIEESEPDGWLYLDYQYSGIDNKAMEDDKIKENDKELKGIGSNFLKNIYEWMRSCNNASLNRVLNYIYLVEKLKQQEHRRWNAYMRSEGYIYAKERFDLGKRHPDLLRYSDLPLKERNKDVRMNMITELLSASSKEKRTSSLAQQ